MKSLLPIVAIALTTACAQNGSAGYGASSGVPVTSANQLQLNLPVTIAANTARVFYQFGKQVADINQFKRHCSLRVLSPKGETQELVPDTIQVRKHELYREPAITAYHTVRTKVYLQSDKNPDLIYMECIDMFDYWSQMHTIGVGDVEDIFGDHLDVL